MKTDWYSEFVDLGYRPKASDVVCLFRAEPDGMSMKEVAGRIASESSCGTWTTLAHMPRIKELMAKVFEIKGNFLKVAYPIELFEQGAITSFMSGPGGNIFGMKAVRNLRMQDVSFSKEFIKNFKGPNYGSSAIRKIFKRKSGPITSVVPKPKLGYSAEEHARKVAYAIWRGGMDCVKDDENLSSQKFNRFEERVAQVAKYRDRAERETGDVKDAFINVTSPNFKELEKRIRTVHEHGFKYFMLDTVVSGFTAVQTAVDFAHDYDMAIHGHRAMHAMFTKNPKHGMSMLCLAKLMRLVGIDQLHIGTVVGKLGGVKEEIIATKEMVMRQSVSEIKNLRMPQKWGKIKPMIPVASGGLHPGLLPQVFDIYGTMNIVIQAGGGTQGHPAGIEAGARAVMQSIEAYKQKIPLAEYAKSHKELQAALDKWGYLRPR